MARTRQSLIAFRPAGERQDEGWQGVAAVAYDAHVDCQGYELVRFDDGGTVLGRRRLPADTPRAAFVASGDDPEGWRDCYVRLDDDSGPPRGEVERRSRPPQLDVDRRECLRDQYGRLFDDVAALTDEAEAALVLPHLRGFASVEALRAAAGASADAIWAAWLRYPDVDPAEKQVLSDVEEYGWHAVSVGADGEGPAFTYSIGFQRTLGHPELIVVGLDSKLAHGILRIAYGRVEQGERFEPDREYAGLLEGFPVRFLRLGTTAYAEYLGYALWFYEGSVDALQLVWPGAQTGAWPWQDESVRELQPLLAPREVIERLGA